MAGVIWEVMLFAVQAVLKGSLLTKCLDKTCLQWLLGEYSSSVYGIMLIQRNIGNARVYFKFRHSAEYSVIAIKGLSGVCVCTRVCVLKH